jgi:hypothetical protein
LHWAIDAAEGRLIRGQFEVSFVSSGRLSVPARGDRCCGSLVRALWLSYHDLEELLGERGIELDHVTMYRWVQTFPPEFVDAARPSATGQSARAGR